MLRDHAISHALAAIASIGIDDVVFFGGTALSRTYLTDIRLSEDIDLEATAPLSPTRSNRPSPGACAAPWGL